MVHHHGAMLLLTASALHSCLSAGPSVNVNTSRRLLRPGSAFSAAVPSFGYSGFDRFPAFYFGAAEGTGLQSAAELQLIARHALAGWGWQQGHGAGAHGEAQGQAAATRLRSVAPRRPNGSSGSGGSSPDALWVYRQSESLFTYYDLMAAVAANATLAGSARLTDPLNASQPCGGGGLLGYGKEPFRSYWIGA